MIVGGGIHSLGQIDNDGAIFVYQHIEFGEVAMNQSGAEHSLYVK